MISVRNDWVVNVCSLAGRRINSLASIFEIKKYILGSVGSDELKLTIVISKLRYLKSTCYIVQILEVCKLASSLGLRRR